MKNAKGEALKKKMEGGKKCHCGKEKGHEGKHREGKEPANITFKKEGGHESEGRKEKEDEDE